MVANQFRRVDSYSGCFSREAQSKCLRDSRLTPDTLSTIFVDVVLTGSEEDCLWILDNVPELKIDARPCCEQLRYWIFPRESHIR